VSEIRRNSDCALMMPAVEAVVLMLKVIMLARHVSKP